MKKISPKNILSFISLALFFPMIASAQEKLSAADFMRGIGDLDTFIRTLTTGAVKSTGVLFMAVAMVVFLLGIIQYIWGLRQGKADATTTGKTFMSWGLVALFVMFSVYGIVKLAQSVFFSGKDINTITIPELNFGPRNPGTPTTPAAPLTPVTGTTGNAAFDACIQAGGGVVECRRMTSSPNSGGSQTIPAYSCEPNSTNCIIPGSNGQRGRCSSAGNSCEPLSSAGQSSGAYECSPKAECTIPGSGGQIGLCNDAGNACSSNAAPVPDIQPGGI